MKNLKFSWGPSFLLDLAQFSGGFSSFFLELRRIHGKFQKEGHAASTFLSKIHLFGTDPTPSTFFLDFHDNQSSSRF